MLADGVGARHYVVDLDMPWKGSSLFSGGPDVPVGRTQQEIKSAVPSTYVPARNTVFLAMAASCAEAIGASEIFIGAHWQDSSGYPDCRREYLEAFNDLISLGTREGASGKLRIKFPLIGKSKSQIIRLGAALGVPLANTWSCYKGQNRPCGECDSCILRARGFEEAGVEDGMVCTN
jgi:7-cyano-7-deazaguanine synthase